VHQNAKRSQRRGSAKHSVISKTSGGMGKNEDSANENPNSAGTACFVLAQRSIQKYKRFKGLREVVVRDGSAGGCVFNSASIMVGEIFGLRSSIYQKNS
jgi:hypothetical protein